MFIRDATPQDATACAAIYTPYVLDTAISFELNPPDTNEMHTRISRAITSHAWLILEEDASATTAASAHAGATTPVATAGAAMTADGARRVVGYAYGGAFAPRAAYRFACEVSVYLAAEARGRGGGRALYEVLLDRLAARGYRMAFAGMTLPNDASAGLHRALGFELSGTYRAVGWKSGAWHDVAWFQKPLGPDAAAPPAGEPS
jgi:L-amino acid N-acyltransferase YncA